MRTGERFELDAMSAAERKVVHTWLQDHAGVATASAGRSPTARRRRAGLPRCSARGLASRRGRDARADGARPGGREGGSARRRAARAAAASRHRGADRRCRLGERIARDPACLCAAGPRVRVARGRAAPHARSWRAGRRPMRVSSAAGPRSRRPTGRGSRSRRRSHRLRSRPSGACRFCGRAGSRSSGWGRAPTSSRSLGPPHCLPPRPRRRPRVWRLAQDRPDPAWLPAPDGSGAEAAARVRGNGEPTLSGFGSGEPGERPPRMPD